ncbi:MAG TPA: anthranilate synthase component I family protein [Syntrophothermus lipocalidus]|nr:anthranilate synthase component I family protein [Syntrophothermus lipocalidus]
MRGDRNICAGTHLGAGFDFSAFHYTEKELFLPGFDLYRYFSAMAGKSRSQPLFFLESLTEGENARYSILGLDPLLVVEYSQGKLSVTTDNRCYEEQGELFTYLRAFLAAQSVVHLTAPASGFTGGLVGFWGYDIGLEQEKIPRRSVSLSSGPDAAFFFPGVTVVHDRYTDQVRVRSFYPNSIQEREGAVAKLEQVVAGLSLSQDTVPVTHCRRKVTGNPDAGFISNTSYDQFIDMVRQAKEYIRIGDAFQIVLSQCWKKRTRASPLGVYAELRHVNPSPYMFYLGFPSMTLVGSSPEMLVKVEGDVVQTRPIAGTRPVTGDEKLDDALRRELVRDEKERAEHLMLVDLGRNDIGKVSRPGTVEVVEFMKLEVYSHVVHLVSKVQGCLREGLDSLAALQACFPAGTLTGAPKHRAMEIINFLEKSSRGPYGGAVGYVGLDGNLDSCITIRSVLFRGEHCYLQAGAGIVADSVPENEYQETVNKAKALMQAVLSAEGEQ